MLFLAVFILDNPNRAPAGLHLDFPPPHPSPVFPQFSTIGYLLESICIHMFDFDGQDIALLCQLTNSLGIRKRAGDLGFLTIDLFGGCTLCVQNCNLNVQSMGSFCEHAPKLATAQNPNYSVVHDFRGRGHKLYFNQTLSIAC